MHAGISAQRLSHFLCDHHHSPLQELNAGTAATNQHEVHTGGEEALKTPDKKGPLTNTVLIISNSKEMNTILTFICRIIHNIISTLYQWLHTHSHNYEHAPNLTDTNTHIVA